MALISISQTNEVILERFWILEIGLKRNAFDFRIGKEWLTP